MSSIFSLREKFPHKPIHLILGEGVTDALYQGVIVKEIVHGIEPVRQQFPGQEEMPEVGPGKITTGITAAARIRGSGIRAKACLLDVERA